MLLSWDARLAPCTQRPAPERRREILRRASAIAGAAGRAIGVGTLAGTSGARAVPQSLADSFEQAIVALRHARAEGTPIVRFHPALGTTRAELAPEAFDRLRVAFSHGERGQLEAARLDFFRDALLWSAGRPGELRIHLGYALHSLLEDVARRGILAPRRLDEIAQAAHRHIDHESTIDGLEVAYRQAVSELIAACLRPADAERGAVTQRVLRYMTGHLDRPISRAEIAKEVGLSPSHLSRVFQRTKGRGLRDELRARRLGKVAELLQVTDLPVRQICGAAGFRSYTAFFRVFRRACGETPVAYRRARRA